MTNLMSASLTAVCFDVSFRTERGDVANPVFTTASIWNDISGPLLHQVWVCAGHAKPAQGLRSHRIGHLLSSIFYSFDDWNMK